MRGRPITCCFTGHRPAKLPWHYDERDPRCLLLKDKLRDAVATAYQTGYRHFICGMALGCDLYFAEAILALRQQHGDVTLEAAIPCPGQDHAWPADQRERYHQILEACDFETMVQDHYGPGCMQRRNRYMVDHSSLVIAVYDGSSGGTRQTLEYAIRQRIDFLDIHPGSAL